MNPTSAAPGSAQAFLLVVSDIVAARQQLVAQGIDASEVFHCASGTGCRFAGNDVRVSGSHPERLSYGFFVSWGIQVHSFHPPSPRALLRCSRTAEWCSLALAFTICRKIIRMSLAPISKNGSSILASTPARGRK